MHAYSMLACWTQGDLPIDHISLCWTLLEFEFEFECIYHVVAPWWQIILQQYKTILCPSIAVWYTVCGYGSLTVFSPEVFPNPFCNV
jgi:hypothetical protein